MLWAPTMTVMVPLSCIADAPIPLGQHATMTILHAAGGTHPSFNENSVVVRLDLGATRVLLIGGCAEGSHQSLPPWLRWPVRLRAFFWIVN